jgi:hypothetical protein
MHGTSYARLLVGTLLLLLPEIAAAQTQASVVKNADLSFGNLGTSPSAGTAILDPATGIVTVTGGVVNLGGTQTAASFTVSTPPAGNLFYTIILPLNATLTGPGSATMLVDTFTSNPPCCSGKGRNDIVTVGATLHISANQAQGNYSGTANFIVTRP